MLKIVCAFADFYSAYGAWRFCARLEQWFLFDTPERWVLDLKRINDSRGNLSATPCSPSTVSNMSSSYGAFNMESMRKAIIRDSLRRDTRLQNNVFEYSWSFLFYIIFTASFVAAQFTALGCYNGLPPS